MTASEYQSQMVPFAMELANRISLRLEHHNSLNSFEIEDIEQELLTYVLERASQFDPSKGSIDVIGRLKKYQRKEPLCHLHTEVLRGRPRTGVQFAACPA